MRATPAPEIEAGEIRRALGRLEALPMRPTSARHALSAFVDDDDLGAAALATAVPPRLPASAESDPAWALERSKAPAGRVDPLLALERHAWWPASASTGPEGEALDRLWRHSAAVAGIARRLAREAEDSDPEAVARAGLLHALGLWALAAVSPPALAAWFAEPNAEGRRALERKLLGTEASSLGRLLATRWGCEPLVVEAAWLHADREGDLNACSDRPGRLALVQRAYALARRTPWAPESDEPSDPGPVNPRARIATAEVQSRCLGSFVAPDASAREERLTRDNARLRRALTRLRSEHDSRDRLSRALAASSPEESPESWAERAGLAWCGEAGVASARVVWVGPTGSSQAARPPLPGSTVLPLGDPGRPCALVHLRPVEGLAEPLATPTILPAWDAWARIVAERERLRSLLDEAVAAHRGRATREEPARRRAMLEALAEFAAGAGHELNNPLAVIVGRAQLLLARAEEPDAVRSLRAIIAQAQRAHRILRDLMYVARPPEPRPRPCQPEEVVRACLRDLQDEAEARGVRIVADTREPALKVWADPEPLRQVADILTRNALEATPAGGLVRFTAGGDARAIRWTVHDNGRGITPGEGPNLFNPFYCGRQAGRGLGLGLPRAARIVAQAGGDLSWRSSPGLGTTFQVTIPVGPIPAPVEDPRPGSPSADRAPNPRPPFA